MAVTATPFARPLYVMLKPAGAACNLRCGYCYYLDKPRGTMSDDLLERFTRQYIEAQTTDEVLFTWHGGEALLRPLDFYKKAVELQRRHAGGRRICNALQTNGTMLTEEWARFLHAENWLVGVSIDGPGEVHDRYRRDAAGKPTWAKVRRGIDLLNKHGVEWNAMAVVHRDNAHDPGGFYRFFRDELRCRFVQFAPIVERGLACNVGPEQWGSFLCGMFDEWVRRDVGEMFVQMFDATLACWMGVTPGLCTLATECGHAGVMDTNGDVYACDHFVYPAYRLGNIMRQTLAEMMYGPRQVAFGRAKRASLPRQCRQCRWLFACNGECPKNRLDGGVNYLCPGYREYFAHVAPAMDRMRQLLMQGRPASDVML